MNLILFLAVTFAAAPLPTAEVKPHNGAPTLYINGTPQDAVSYMTYSPTGKYFAEMGKAGVHLYTFSATPTESTYNLAKLCWVAPDKFEYATIDDPAHLLLGNDADAYCFPRLYLGTPAWWADAHPDDCVRYDPGDGNPKQFVLNGKKIASWASQVWREDTANALRKLIAHAEQSDYAARVIGYHLASGTTEEWMQWGSNEDQWTDYSSVNVAKWRAWLKGEYKVDAGLAKAWHDPAATLANATIPTREQRGKAYPNDIRNPDNAQAAIDYARYTSWLVTDTMRYFAAVVKEAVKRQRLVGVFYGYVLQLAGEQREQNSGHLALQAIFDCPDIDFVTSPTSYAFRDIGTGFPHAMSLVDSVKLHGKLWFDENDVRTWIAKSVAAGAFGKTATYEESLLAQQREFAWTLTNRLGMWWFDMGGGWYDDPRLLDEFAKMKRIAADCMTVDGSPVAEIALVVDDISSAWLVPGVPYSAMALVQQLPELGRVGAPFVTIHVADIEKAPNYKLYIFPNCIAPTEKVRAAIKKKLKDTGAASIWIGPAGTIRNNKIDIEAMKELTGFNVGLRTLPPPDHQVAPIEGVAEFGWKNAQPFDIVPRTIMTRITPNPHDAGSSEKQSPSTDFIVAVAQESKDPIIVRHAGGPLTVYSSAPKLPAGLLRAIAEKAGVHLYSDAGDIVWASHDLIAVSVNTAGVRTIKLPRKCDVIDLWDGKTIGAGVDSVQVEIAEKGTALLRLKNINP